MLIKPTFTLPTASQCTWRTRRTHRGFTLIETMVVVAIAAILLAIAAPSFQALTERWRVRQAVDGLQSAMYYARSEAIKRGGGVILQKNPNNYQGCTTAVNGADWDCGWFVCQDANNNGTCDGTDPVLQRFENLNRVSVSRIGGAGTIQFNRWGLVDGALPSFSMVPLSKNISDPAARGLCMSSGGRIAVISNPPC